MLKVNQTKIIIKFISVLTHLIFNLIYVIDKKTRFKKSLDYDNLQDQDSNNEINFESNEDQNPKVFLN